MNGKKVSKFFVANYLWDMMEEEWWQIFSKYIWQSMRHISQEAITWSMHIDVWTFEHCSLFELVKCPGVLLAKILSLKLTISPNSIFLSVNHHYLDVTLPIVHVLRMFGVHFSVYIWYCYYNVNFSKSLLFSYHSKQIFQGNA